MRVLHGPRTYFVPFDRKLATLEFAVPQPKRRKVTDQVLIDLIEANVDIGFGLVDEAKAHRVSGQIDFSSRALKEAAHILADIERRLGSLAESESAPFVGLVTELRREIAAAEQDSAI